MGNACHIMINVLCIFVVLYLLICCLKNYKSFLMHACLCLALLPPTPHAFLAHFWCRSSPHFRTLIIAGWSMEPCGTAYYRLHTYRQLTIKPFTLSHLMGPYVPNPLSLPTRGLEHQLTLQCSQQCCYILLSQSHSILYNHNYSC